MRIDISNKRFLIISPFNIFLLRIRKYKWDRWRVLKETSSTDRMDEWLPWELRPKLALFSSSSPYRLLRSQSIKIILGDRQPRGILSLAAIEFKIPKKLVMPFKLSLDNLILCNKKKGGPQQETNFHYWIQFIYAILIYF